MNFLKVIFHLNAIIQYGFLKILYGSRFTIGKHTTWRKHFSVMVDVDAKVKIGSNCFFNNDCAINANKLVKIGDGTIFGENVKIYDHNHKFADSSTTIKEQGFSVGEVVIGSHCWIGSNVVILKGTIIGDNCVIGAGVVLSGEIKSNTIVKNKRNFIMETIKGAENHE